MKRGQRLLLTFLLAAAVTYSPNANGAPPESPAKHGSITDRSVDWPTWQQWRRVLLLEDYNTRIVLLGTMLLGLAGGLVGNFTLLRKRALMGDALSHATLPGVGIAFIAMTWAGGDGKSLAVLLAGAAASGLLGLATVLFIRNATRLKEDAALGIVLSVFFGVGVAVLGVAQQMKTGHAAGLEAFIYGKAASMGAFDAKLIGASGLIAAIVCVILFKELRLLCFDEPYAASRGYPVLSLDILLMVLVVLVTLIGLQAVGLILMVAMLIVPAAAARFWTERMWVMALVSAGLGAASAFVGAGMSAVFPRLPSGAMIVLVATLAFTVSMFVGPARGVIVRAVRHRQIEARIQRQHALRAVYESLESVGLLPTSDTAMTPPVSFAELLSRRSWSPHELSVCLRRAVSRGLLQFGTGGEVRLTQQGLKDAMKLTYDHRLWEIYLTRYADVAPSQVDRSADAIEHVLGPEMVAELESLLQERMRERALPVSLHPIERLAPAKGSTS